MAPTQSISLACPLHSSLPETEELLTIIANRGSRHTAEKKKRIESNKVLLRVPWLVLLGKSLGDRSNH